MSVILTFRKGAAAQKGTFTAEAAVCCNLRAIKLRSLSNKRIKRRIRTVNAEELYYGFIQKSFIASLNKKIQRIITGA